MPADGAAGRGLPGRVPYKVPGHVVFLLAILAFLAVVSQPVPANTLRPVTTGDQLRVTIREAPDLSHTGSVGPDGYLMLPLLGSVAVEGLDLDAVAQLVSRELQERDLIRQATVLVEMASYRPVFVGGAVARSGKIEFEPGLTVRQAIMTAGGIATQDTAKGTGHTDLAKLAATRRGLVFELAAVNSRIDRIETELQLSEKPEGAEPSDVRSEAGAGPTSEAAPIATLDKAVLSDRLANQETERAYFDKRLKLLEMEISFLTEQRKMQEQERAIQQDEITNARTLLERGLLRRPQFQEMQREASRMDRDVLETEAFAARARQAVEILRQELDTSITSRRIELRSLLREDMARRAAIEVEIETLDADLVASGLAMADAGEIRQFQPVLTVHRRNTGGVEQFTIGMDDLLEPGDVVEVGLNPGYGG